MCASRVLRNRLLCVRCFTASKQAQASQDSVWLLLPAELSDPPPESSMLRVESLGSSGVIRSGMLSGGPNEWAAGKSQPKCIFAHSRDNKTTVTTLIKTGRLLIKSFKSAARPAEFPETLPAAPTGCARFPERNQHGWLRPHMGLDLQRVTEDI